MTIEIRRLRPHDADRLFTLRRQALRAEPFAFLSSPEDDRASSPEAVRAQLGADPDKAAVFGAFAGEALVGMVGLARDHHIKAAHRALVWGMFVAPEHRRRGIGARLLRAALDHARGMTGLVAVHLSVSEKMPDARRLYEAAGFVVWGLQPDSMRIAGESAGDHHLTLAL